MEEGYADLMICRIMDELLAPDICRSFFVVCNTKVRYVPNCGFMLAKDENAHKNHASKDTHSSGFLNSQRRRKTNNSRK
jgi:hypothetical protein